MSKTRFIKKFTVPFDADVRRKARTCTRRLKAYLDAPSLARALAFDVAAEEQQIAAGRQHAAANLAEAWKL